MPKPVRPIARESDRTVDQVKIALRGADDDVETLWADPLGDGLYRLDNLPWYAYRVSLGDVVEARPNETGQLEMVRIVRKSGNRTLRVILAIGETDRAWTFESRQTIERLQAFGCSHEGANKVLVALNAPAAVDLTAVADLLTSSGFEWEYADPPFEDLFPHES